MRRNFVSGVEGSSMQRNKVLKHPEAWGGLGLGGSMCSRGLTDHANGFWLWIKALGSHRKALSKGMA